MRRLLLKGGEPAVGRRGMFGTAAGPDEALFGGA
jgi:hypothetical protein